MDDRLRNRLVKVEVQMRVLRDAEKIFLELEANKKALVAQIYLKSPGKNVAEKEAHTYASEDWTNFSKALAEAESTMNHERRLFDLKLKAFDAEYLTLKTESPVIKRQL